MTECRNYTLEMGTTNIINQEQAGKLGQNQQSMGKQFKLLNVHIYLYLEKNFNNTLWNTPWFNKSRSSSNQPTSNVFCTCADFPVHRHSRFSRFQLPAECRMKIKPVMMLIIINYINFPVWWMGHFSSSCIVINLHSCKYW